jgi:hypothetical protein
MKYKKTISLAAILLTVLIGQSAHADDRRNGSHAVTLWWLFFNNPDECLSNPGAPEQCGEIDVFGEAYLESIATGSPDPSLISPNADAKLAVIYATGGITDTRGRIRLVASAYRSAPDVPLSMGPSVVDPLGLGRALENPDAEVHLVIRDHGRKVRDGKIAQITNFLEPFCSDPLLLFYSGQNTCQDLQFAVFGPGESGLDSVFAFGNPPKRIRRASAYLFRNGDMFQAVVETQLPADRHRND